MCTPTPRAHEIRKADLTDQWDQTPTSLSTGSTVVTEKMRAGVNYNQMGGGRIENRGKGVFIKTSFMISRVHENGVHENLIPGDGTGPRHVSAAN